MIVIQYDPRADILSVRTGEVVEEDLLDNDVVVGFDERGNVVYIEVWDASKRSFLESLIKLVEKLTMSATEAAELTAMALASIAGAR